MTTADKTSDCWNYTIRGFENSKTADQTSNHKLIDCSDRNQSKYFEL